MIAQMRAFPFQPHRRRVRIGGADFEVCRAKVVAMHLPRFSTFLRDPVVPRRVLTRQFLLLGFGEHRGQRDRFSAGHRLWCSSCWC